MGSNGDDLYISDKISKKKLEKFKKIGDITGTNEKQLYKLTHTKNKHPIHISCLIIKIFRSPVFLFLLLCVVSQVEYFQIFKLL